MSNLQYASHPSGNAKQISCSMDIRWDKASWKQIHRPSTSLFIPPHTHSINLRINCIGGLVWMGGGHQGFPTPLQDSIKFQFKSHVGYVVTQGRNTMWLNSATNMVTLVCEIDLTMDVLLENGTRCCGHSNILYKETFLCASLFMWIMRVKHQSHKLYCICLYHAIYYNTWTSRMHKYTNSSSGLFWRICTCIRNVTLQHINWC